MRHGGEAVLALNAVHDHQRFVARAAACAVGDRTVIRFEFHQRGNGLFQQRAVAFWSLRRKEFKRNHWPVIGEFLSVNITNELHWRRMMRRAAAKIKQAMAWAVS